MRLCERLEGLAQAMQKCQRPRVGAVEMMGLAHQLLTLEAQATPPTQAEAVCSYRAALPK
jgi:hypothetical protein